MARARRRAPRHRNACSAGRAGAESRNRLHRSRDRSDRRTGGRFRGLDRSRTAGLGGAGMCLGRGAARRVAAHLDRPALARGAGSDHRRRVRARRNRRAAVARGESPRRRAPSRSADRPDSVGEPRASRDRACRVCGAARGDVREGLSTHIARCSTCCSPAQPPFRSSSSGCISSSRRSSCLRLQRVASAGE